MRHWSGWLLVTAGIEFIDMYRLQICLSSVNGLSWCAVVCQLQLVSLYLSDNLLFLISNSLNIDDEFGMFAEMM
jgi:hypothetical protein